MEFCIEKYAMLIKRNGETETTKLIELNQYGIRIFAEKI